MTETADVAVIQAQLALVKDAARSMITNGFVRHLPGESKEQIEQRAAVLLWRHIGRAKRSASPVQLLVDQGVAEEFALKIKEEGII